MYTGICEAFKVKRVMHSVQVSAGLYSTEEFIISPLTSAAPGAPLQEGTLH